MKAAVFKISKDAIVLCLFCIPEKPGVCPKPQGVSHCAFMCSNDYECQKDKKCCRNACGGTDCMTPIRKGKDRECSDAPPPPPHPQSGPTHHLSAREVGPPVCPKASRGTRAADLQLPLVETSWHGWTLGVSQARTMQHIQPA